MTDPEPTNESFDTLFDDYVNGLLDATRTRDLEAWLLADVEARRAFVRYTRLHTDLLLELRARKASDRALELIGQDLPAAARTSQQSREVRHPRRPLVHRLASWFAASAVLLLIVWGGWRLFGPRPANDEAVAWLVNAQNCTWTDGEPPGELRAGGAVRIDRGLADLRFRCGTRILVEGPAHLDLVSANSVRLRQGKLTARVPADAIGFEVVSPQGKVIDLGTEFGMSVAANGVTDVYVFEGQVEAYPAGKSGKLNLGERQAARIAAGQVTPTDSDPGQFVRTIVPSPIVTPRRTKLTFDGAIDGTLRDRTGAGTGLTHRLPGTGEMLAVHDEYLRLDAAGGRLELTATRSDLNTQYRLRRGEYLGVRLSDLGFTGSEDFEISAVFPEIPALEFVGQFGLYAGARSERAIRGGVLKLRKEGAEVYTQFLVNNADGRDADLYEVGLLRPGTDLRLTLRREAGKYTLSVEDLTAGGASTLAIRHPDYLDPEPDLYVGLFAAEPRSDVGRKLFVREFQATVWASTR
jgi:hypothetical protein